MATSCATLKLKLSDPYAELPIKNHKYVTSCTELHMANKRIAKIANFDAFVNLEVLWINSNQLQQLDGLKGCFRMKQLYAHNNCIRSLENSSLPHLKFLQELRLYGNMLNDLQGTLKVLSRLSRLRDLDLFDNAVVEEENYRLQVIRAIPSLDVLDRHVITVEERTKAARLQVEDGAFSRNNKKCKKELTLKAAGALSGTVKMLFEEVEATKRAQQKEALETSEREFYELKRDQQSALSTTSSCRRVVHCNNADKISGLDEYEVAALKKHFMSFEKVKNGGIGHQNLEQMFRYLHTRGYAVLINGRRFEAGADDLHNIERDLPATGNIQWKSFVQLFVMNQLHCEVLSSHELQQQAVTCFDKCAVIQRQLNASGTSEAKSAQLVMESLALSQQGYHLQALVDNLHSSSISNSSQVLSSAEFKDKREITPALQTRTRFYMTAFPREKTPAYPSMTAGRIGSYICSNLTNEIDHISDTLAGKYKIQQKVRMLVIIHQLFYNDPLFVDLIRTLQAT